MKLCFILMLYFISLCTIFTCTTETNTILVNQTIKDGQTIVSPEETFELGFFSPGNTSNRYVGIWYKRLATDTIVWVANRNTPIRNRSGELTLLPNGVLTIRDSVTNITIWSSSSSRIGNTPVAQLLDNGNFIITGVNEESENYVWQSFDHPVDTMLPGAKLGRNLETGMITNCTSWKSVDDPSQGSFMTYMDFNGLPQVFLKSGDVIEGRLGSWNGVRFTGAMSNEPNGIYAYTYVSNEKETYLVSNLISSSVLSIMRLNPAGVMGRYNWINPTQGWFLYSQTRTDLCSEYALCGVYGSCDITQTTICGCLKGFKPINVDQWKISDWTSGCQRERALNCSVEVGFQKYSFMKLPDTRKSWFDVNMSLEECNVKCKNECNCTAYATLDIKYAVGCLIWYDNLIDMRILPNNGQDIYIKLDALELEKDKRSSRRKNKTIIIVVPVIIAFVILLGVCFLITRKKKFKLQVERGGLIADKDVIELPLFSLSTLVAATNDFSISNKLGQGGFGPVYKGTLKDGREIAVKRLSLSSSQGVEEFKNEVIFISRLQHRNLVKILGYCVEGQEKLLVYEYMPNKGLDLYLFDEAKSKMLDWSRRYEIINGVARGLLYLHQDSRLRIIHRDLKAANILLDRDMNPRISDFGLARSFGGDDDTQTNTKRVVGSYGYMSPEYAGQGIYSVKSDVFSFGVLMLEIVSGIQNRHNLVSHAWNLYKEDKLCELVDTHLIEPVHTIQVLRSIQVGLLCVQNNHEDRPNMPTVVMMLTSEGPLPEPKQPGFYTEGSTVSSNDTHTEDSYNNVTITLLAAR